MFQSGSRGCRALVVEAPPQIQRGVAFASDCLHTPSLSPLKTVCALQIPVPTPPGVITSCLSFLLVFRTNNSYSRFDEARKLWGSLVNRGRDIVRQARGF